MINKKNDVPKIDIAKKVIFIITRVIVLIEIAFAIFKVVTASSSEDRSDLSFILGNAIALFIASFVPSILERAWKIEIPSLMEIIFIVFCFLALFLGEINDFYAKFSWWDSMLHTSSGILIASLGFFVLNTLNESNHVNTKMSPVFICIFAFSFSVAIGALWEIVEWTLDGINGSNMQRYRDNSDASILFEGREALKDTMKDLILDVSGSLLVSVIGYVDLKNKKIIVPKLVLKKDELEEDNKKIINHNKTNNLEVSNENSKNKLDNDKKNMD